MVGVKRSSAAAYLSSSSDSLGGSTAKRPNKRQFIKSNFDKWQREHERYHQTLTWLCCTLEEDGEHMVALYCAIWKKYERNITAMKNLSNSKIAGSTNLKLSNMLDNPKSDVHKAAMTRMRADGARERGQQY